jgi:hypothetical protein
MQAKHALQETKGEKQPMKKLRFLVPLVFGLITALLPTAMAAAQANYTTVKFTVTYTGQGSFQEDYSWHGQRQSGPTRCYTGKSPSNDIDVNTTLTVSFFPNAQNCTGSPSYTGTFHMYGGAKTNGFTVSFGS